MSEQPFDRVAREQAAAVPAQQPAQHQVQQYAQHQVQHQPPSSAMRQPVAKGIQMKERNPLGVWIGLPLITLGIYGYVWYYMIHSELADFDRRRVISPGGALAALLFGWLTAGIWTLVSFYGAGKKIADAQRAAGLSPTCSPGLGLVLLFILGLGILYYQAELNKVVRANSNVPPGHEVFLYV
ncbi:DUF4234 domain-containing protein [Streptosporangiaceae bacterium NEAU-GS5]|nr:DUF4234 domain-containing protein [Streptosporangiaceae bacterium NEAU-GS5]